MLFILIGEMENYHRLVSYCQNHGIYVISAVFYANLNNVILDVRTHLIVVNTYKREQNFTHPNEALQWLPGYTDMWEGQGRGALQSYERFLLSP